MSPVAYGLSHLRSAIFRHSAEVNTFSRSRINGGYLQARYFPSHALP